MSPFDLAIPSVKRTTTSTKPYDPAKPPKYWIDSRANDPANPETIFGYKSYIHGDGVPFVTWLFSLSRADAGAANIPGANDKPKVDPVTVPMRDLLLSEHLEVDSFGKYAIVTVSLAEVLRVCNEILAKVSK